MSMSSSESLSIRKQEDSNQQDQAPSDLPKASKQTPSSKDAILQHYLDFRVREVNYLDKLASKLQVAIP